MPFNLYSNNGHNKLDGHISKKVAKLVARLFSANLWVAITWQFFIRFLPHQNDQLIGTSPMVKISKLHLRSDFGFLSHFLPPVATWATLGARTQKYLGTCLPIATKSLLKIDVPDKSVTIPPPPPLNRSDLAYILCIIILLPKNPK